MGAFIPIRRWWQKKFQVSALSYASGWWPLITSMFGNVGGDTTFTRATYATIQDFELRTRLCLKDESRFEGARRVENLVNFSEDFSNALWLLSGTITRTGKTVIDGIPCMELSIAGGVTSGIHQIISPIVNRIYAARALVRSKSGNINLRVNVGSGYSADIPVGEKWIWIGYTSAAIIGGTSAAIRNESGGGAKDIYVAAYQAEEVTGQANQDPSEYVSNGVLAAPYHGANVDGVKYFDTYNATTLTASAGGYVDDGATGAAIPNIKGYLAETSRKNSVRQSGDMTHADWTNINCASAITASIDSLGGFFTRINPTAPGNAIQGTNDVVVTPGARYTVSGEFQTNINVFAGLVIADIAGAFLQGGAIFDLANGLVISTAGAGSPTATIEPGIAANTWRCTLSADMDALQAACSYGASASDGATYVNTIYGSAAIAASLKVNNMQFEPGDEASTLIPTTTLAFTRNGEILNTIRASNTLVKEVAGTIYCEMLVQRIGVTQRLLTLNDGTVANTIELFINTGNFVRVVMRSPGTVVGLNTLATVAIGDFLKIAVSWREDYVVLSVNGINIFDLIATPLPANLANVLEIGFTVISGVPLMAHVTNVRTWDYQLADADMIAITTP